ncbi:uncharacterized protein LOC111396718 [Olea europaea var. sylvestris]|uniref:uncharacterized protein LOC111396718 n=1 Tax=Olea europaea var. sylvestris TaxID=158386 RepID=UPI000C1D6332|nr:uncharacterized protein LOC111396718 [Olea europaea var. sylvestris]XP_022878962.1 uncharacterized protein LOC111396718 [Olea europaea var. sylvestris]
MLSHLKQKSEVITLAATTSELRPLSLASVDASFTPRFLILAFFSPSASQYFFACSRVDVRFITERLWLALSSSKARSATFLAFSLGNFSCLVSLAAFIGIFTCKPFLLGFSCSFYGTYCSTSIVDCSHQASILSIHGRKIVVMFCLPALIGNLGYWAAVGRELV